MFQRCQKPTLSVQVPKEILDGLWHFFWLCEKAWREVPCRKVTIVIDKCPIHPNFDNLKAIKLMFLPPNTTSKTQPMDQGVIRALKIFYRPNVVRCQIKYIDAGRTIAKINILEAMHFLSGHGTLYLQSLLRIVLERQPSRRKHRLQYKSWRWSFQIAWRGQWT